MALTKYNYNSFDITPVASKALGFNSSADGFTTVTEGSMVLIKTLTASSDATLSFVDGTDDVVLDNTYPTYLFKFINCHPATDQAEFTVNFRDGSTAYDATKTSTVFGAYQGEDGSDPELTYNAGSDVAQGTGVQNIGADLSNANDGSASGELWLFNPSSTTFVKHYMAKCQSMHTQPASFIFYVAGYCNVTAAIDGVQFKMSSGDIDAGTIKLYGIKDS